MDWFDEAIKKCGIVSFLRENKNLYLYGAGETAKLTIKSIEEYYPEIQIVGVLDNDINIHGEICGIPIVFSGNVKDVHNMKVLITSRSPYQLYMDALRLGISDADIYFPRTTYFIDGTFMNNWVTGAVIYKKMLDIINHKNQVMDFYNSLDNELSRKVLKNVVLFRMLQEPQLITEICEVTNSDYWENSPFELSDNEALVDVGALNGDTSLEFIFRTKGKYDQIYLFEPNSNLLCQAMDNLFVRENRDRIHYFHMAIGDYNGIGHLTIGSNMVGCSGDRIRVGKLDDLIGDKRISLIKMDIEGMEISALSGAFEIIKSQKPKLCICVYHNSCDLWEIPKMLKGMRQDYRFGLRQGSPGVYGDVQTVLYAY